MQIGQAGQPGTHPEECQRLAAQIHGEHGAARRHARGDLQREVAGPRPKVHDRGFRTPIQGAKHLIRSLPGVPLLLDAAEDEQRPDRLFGDVTSQESNDQNDDRAPHGYTSAKR